jgi:diguanylate cyclase (GGDEF)-like protein/PAS domain S-box-containing protein
MKNEKHRFYSLIIIFFIALLGAAFYADNVIIERYVTTSHQQVQKDLTSVNNRLTLNLYNNIQVVKGLPALFAINPSLSQQDFSIAVKQLLDDGNTQLRNIAAAPNLIIKYMYPIEGNEAAIGLDYTTQPKQIEMIKEAMALRKLTLAGPIELVQGGIALIARLPVFLGDEEGGNRFWGIVAAVIDINRLYQQSGLFDDDLSIELAIRGKDAKGEGGEVFFGSPSLFEQDPIEAIITLPNGTWQIVAIPLGGWKTLPDDIWLQRTYIMGIALILFFMLFSFLKATMKTAVANQKFRNLLEGSPIPYALNDNAQRITFINTAFTELFGYTLKDIPTLSDWWEKAYPDKEYRAHVKRLWDVYTEKFQLAEESLLPLEVDIHCMNGSVKTVLASLSVNDGNEFPVILYDITERKQAELAAAEKEEQLLSFYKLDLVGLTITSPEKGWVSINNCLCEMLEYSEQELRTMTWAELTHPDDLAADVEQFTKLLANEINFYSLEKRFISKSGKIIPTNLVVHCTRNSNGEVDYVTAMVQDISNQKEAERQLRIAATAFESQEGMVVTDANTIILTVNSAFTKITGYQATEVIGKKRNILSSESTDISLYTEIWEKVNRSDYWEGEIWNKRKNGEPYPEQLSITAVKDTSGKVTNYVGTLTDITLSKKAEKDIEDLAYYDPLTRLPNRRLMTDRLHHAILSGARSTHEGSLLFLDLDHFKTLNDTLGHDMGDVLLQQVANRLIACVRAGDTVSRFGGDEFVILLENLSTQPIEAAKQTEDIANKILASLNQPYQLASHKYNSSVSIGASLFGRGKLTVDDLLKQADIAMYQAKEDGRNSLRFFDPQMQIKITARVALEKELHHAIEEKQFELYYQVQVDAKHNPLGAEALIRWHHPERGQISPLDFIPLAEETGLILPIGQWVLDTACAQLKAWNKNEQTQSLTLAINVSAKQFQQDEFVSTVMTVVQRHNINPVNLKLELTESLLLNDIDDTISKMNSLAEIGIQFSLDDFGTGYSSLQYLKLLPLHQLKIDRSFIRDLIKDSSDQAIVRTIIAMADSLGLSVIAEGVESDEIQQCLLNEGCTHFQGYLYSKPLPVNEFEAML